MHDRPRIQRWRPPLPESSHALPGFVGLRIVRVSASGVWKCEMASAVCPVWGAARGLIIVGVSKSAFPAALL